MHIIGDAIADKSQRVATLSFTHNQLSSQEIVQSANRQGLGIRYGDFYAVELINTLGLRDQQGVVRASFAHYNSPEEVNQLVTFLKQF